MTGHQAVAVFILDAVALVASFGDCYTTLKGFDIGLTEGNPVARWLQKKLSFAGAAFASVAGFLVVSAALCSLSPASAVVWGAAIAGLETTMTLRNWSLIKKYSKK